MKILFLVPYPLHESPSQRFRFEQYFETLNTTGYSYRVQSFLDSQNWQMFFNSGNTLRKILALTRGYLRRFRILFCVLPYHYVFIHREASPLGPPIFEFILAKIFCKRIIYDFDDAIWLTDRATESWLRSILKWRSKVRSICRWSYKVSCGNYYLRAYASQYNRNAFFNPTTIDTEHLHNRVAAKIHKQKGSLTIGWTGSHSTLKYLLEIEPVLKILLNANKSVSLHVIADQRPKLSIPFQFTRWSASTETYDLLSFDIGIMPLPDNEWTKGKCGFKALQYMALEIPAVASNVGANPDIITDTIDGFLVSSEAEWTLRLTQLINDPQLRLILGKAGRATVVKRYSVKSNTRLFLSLFA